MPPLQCFLVEDSPIIRKELVATLEEMAPVKVVGWADNEQDAVAWLQKPDNACQLVLIDLFLKSGTGLGVLEHLAQSRRAAEISAKIVLSNYATPDVRRQCLALGADRVFDKSSDIDELVNYCAELSP